MDYYKRLEHFGGANERRDTGVLFDPYLGALYAILKSMAF